MQTFLPDPDFLRSAQALDRARLGKQRVECLQILRTLAGVTAGWVNHPAVKMWRGHEATLVRYSLLMCDEWLHRGYKDTCADKLVELGVNWSPKDEVRPPWLGDEAFHRSHKSNLIRKDPNHYRPLWPDVPDDLPYVWPVR